MNLAVHLDRQASRAHPSPTEAQKESGNYRKGHIRAHGLDVAIENSRGSFRGGIDKGGKSWKVRMAHHYGYIKRSEGADGDHVDCYIGPHLNSPKIFVVDQLDADTQKFDEHKCFMGFASRQQVAKAYRDAFSDGRSHDRMGAITEVTPEEFKAWIKDGNTKKPLHRAMGGSIPHMADGGAPDFTLPSDAPTDSFSLPSDAPKQAAQSQGALDTASDVAKSAGTGLAKGAMGLVGLPGDVNSLVGKGFDWASGKVEGAMGWTPEQIAARHAAMDTARNQAPTMAPTTADIQGAVEGVAGPLHEPQTTAGHYAQTVGEFAPAALMGPGNIAKKLVTQAVAPGLASEAAGQATAGTDVEPYARIAGGVLGGVGANMAANSIGSRTAQSALPQAPTVDELKTASRAQFNHPDVAAVQIKPAPVSNLADTIRADLEKQGFRDYANPVPFKAIDELANPRTASATAAAAPVTVQDIGSIRGVLHNAGLERDTFGKLTPDAVAANMAVDHIDNFLVGLKQPDLIAGDAKKAAALLTDARANWGAAKRAENIQTLQRNAEIQAGSTYSGGNQNNATRQALRPLLRNDASKAYGYNDAELGQLEKSVTGTPVGNTARWVGKKLGNVASTAGIVGSIASGNPLPALVLPAGMAARAVGNASAARQGNILDEMLRSRSPLMAARQSAAPAAASQAPTPIYNRALLNALLASTAARDQTPAPQTTQ